MFRVLAEQLAWWPVTFPGVNEDGTLVENKIELRFKILDDDEMVEYAVDCQREPSDEEKKLPASVYGARLLMPVVKDWRQVAGPNGEPWEFNETNFAKFLRVPNVAQRVPAAYRACRAAEPQVREGN